MGHLWAIYGPFSTAIYVSHYQMVECANRDPVAATLQVLGLDHFFQVSLGEPLVLDDPS